MQEFFQNAAKKIFGTQNERELKSIYPIVARINQFEAQIKPLTDAQLAAKTAEFKQRSPTAKRSTRSCPKPSRSCAKPPGACSACATTTCS